jgi:hypothetical protein
MMRNLPPPFRKGSPEMRLSHALAATGAMLALAAPMPALADQFADCERFGTAFFKKQGSSYTRLQIEKAEFPEVNRFDDRIGSQFVSSEIFGIVRLTDAEGMKKRRYLCLHDGKRALYFTLVD